MSRHFFINTIIACSALLTPGCGTDQPETVSAPVEVSGHQRMLDALAEVKRDALETNPYFETKSVIRLTDELSQLGPSAPAVERFNRHWELGPHLLRLGRVDEGIEHLEIAWRLFPEVEHLLTREQHRLLLLDVGVAHLRRGETQNCVHCQAGESCLLPIQGAGVHQDQTGSRAAMAYFRKILELDPKDLTARWLLNIASMTVGEYPDSVPQEFRVPPSAFEATAEFPRFVEVSQTVGLNVLSCSGGVVIDDLDGDSDLDVMVSDWHVTGQIRLLLNRGDGTFEDATTPGGLDGITGGLNLVQADYDNDGDVDVLVLRGAWLGEKGAYPNSLLQNDGRGRFRDVTFDAGLGDVHRPTQAAAWADIDLDGDLDLFIGNEYQSCQLFENNGSGQFTDIAASAGVLNDRFTKGCVFGDIDGDRYPDLFLSNMKGENRLYLNRGDKTFEDIAAAAGVTEPNLSFPCWFWDYNNDGKLDLFVSSYDVGVRYVAADYFGWTAGTDADSLYRGDGAGGFVNVSAETGLTRITQPMGANFGDLDNDGYLDFYLGTGYVEYHGLMPNLMFHNREGKTFEDVTFAARVGHLQKGHGVSFADLDTDGDLDLFVETGGANPGDAFRNVLFENPGFGNHWLSVRLVGVTSNRSAIGARIRADFDDNGTPRSIYRWVNSGGSFGCNPLRQHLGLGRAEKIDRLEIFWPQTGRTQVLTDLAADRVIEITEENSEQASP